MALPTLQLKKMADEFFGCLNVKIDEFYRDAMLFLFPDLLRQSTGKKMHAVSPLQTIECRFFRFFPPMRTIPVKT